MIHDENLQKIALFTYYLFIFETFSHSSYPQFHSTLATSSNYLLFEC